MDAAIFAHLALPAQLPQSEDANLDAIEVCLVDHLLVTARTMRDLPSHEALGPRSSKDVNAWESIRQCLIVSKAVNSGGIVNKSKFLAELGHLGVGNALVLYIRSQNAALLIHRLAGYIYSTWLVTYYFGVCANHLLVHYSSPDQVTFEVFETSAKNEDVLAAQNALRWDFPGNVIAIPIASFHNHGFQDELATFLEHASMESTKAFAGQTFKAGTPIHEYRDTAAPSVISSMLMAILEESGSRIQISRLRKRVRDDVCWLNAAKPWRRSPYWLVLRVAISRFLTHALGEEQGRFEYKYALCMCFAVFMESAHASLEVEQLDFLKAKICRRLVKLDAEKAGLGNGVLRQRIELLSEQLDPRISGILQKTACRMQAEWAEFKRRDTKPIPLLPNRASPSDLILPLRVSGKALRQIQETTSRTISTRRPRWEAPPDLDISSHTREHLARFAQPFLEITNFESTLQRPISSSNLPGCIYRYVTEGLPLYQGNTGQMSILILNAMELWKTLDDKMCREYPLLCEYHPVFSPEILDDLHLASYKDMTRMQSIQGYLHQRIETCGVSSATNIFADPSVECFARRFYDECPDAEPMWDLRETIERAAEEARQSKLEEWQELNNRYESLARQVNESACISTVNENDRLGRAIHVERHCPRCQAISDLQRLRIRIHEHPLPSDDAKAKTAVFELMCPRAFSEYRDVTWMLVSRLASPHLPPGNTPRCLLQEYSQLCSFAKGRKSTVTLASTVKSCRFSILPRDEFLLTNLSNSSSHPLLLGVFSSGGER